MREHSGSSYSLAHSRLSQLQKLCELSLGHPLLIDNAIAPRNTDQLLHRVTFLANSLISL
jgi:hypothetical protein